MPEETEISRPKIGLALGSGASRGWSHIGVIKALLREGIEPDVVCGTSVGAMIGGSYLAGNMDKLERWVRASNRSEVLRFFEVKLSKSGFVDTKRLNSFLQDYVAGDAQRIEDLPRKFAAITTNLETGREVWLTEGVLADSVRASMAMPGLFPPVSIDEHWMVDGGLVNPVPVSVCHALGADVVIAVNLNSGIITRRNNGMREPVLMKDTTVLSNFKQQAKQYSNAIFPSRNGTNEAPGLFFAIVKSINIFQDRITRSRLAGDPADVLLSPQVAHIGMLEFHRAAEAIQEGELCVQRALPEIRQVTGT